MAGEILNRIIRIRDEFSRPIKKLTTGLAASIKRYNQASVAADKFGDSGANAIERAAARADKAAKALAAAQSDPFARNLPSFQGLTDESKKQAEALAKTRLAAERNQTAFQRLSARKTQFVKVVKDSRRNLKDLDEQLGRTDQRANRISFTFRRLFGILAAFTIARNVIRGFQELIKTTVTFNASLEESVLGIAALISSVGDIRDSFGSSVGAAEGLGIATDEARRQVALLRVDALKTAATFDQLVEAFQVGIGPGLEAGLRLDEIREFSVRIAQAAAALGLQQNQLAEEIRSILAGTIQARTTRIAVSLGITNENIREAKELGQLAQFLQIRFAAFGEAGEAALTNFNTILVNLKDGLSQIIGAGGLEFFNNFKSLLVEVGDSLRSVNEDTGEIELSPEAVNGVRVFSTLLNTLVEQARQLRENLSGEGFLAVVQGLTEIANIIVNVLGGAIQGLGKGLANLFKGVDGVAKKLLGLSGTFNEAFAGEDVRALVSAFVELLVTVKGVTFVVGILFAAVKGLLVPLLAVSFAIKQLQVVALSAQFFGLAKALGVVNKSLFIMVGGLVAGIGLGRGLAFVLDKISGIETDRIEAQSRVDTLKAQKEQLEEILAAQEEIDKRNAARPSGAPLEGSLAFSVEEVEEATRKLEELKELQRQILEGDFGVGDKIDKGFLAAGGLLADKISEAVSSVIDKVSIGVLPPEAEEKIESFADRLRTIPGIIAQSTEKLKTQIDSVSDLSSELEKAQAAFNLEQAISGIVDPTVARQARIFSQERVKASKDLELLNKAELDVVARITAAKERQAVIAAQLTGFNSEQVAEFRLIVDENEKINDLKKSILKFENEEVLLAIKIKAELDKAGGGDPQILNDLQNALELAELSVGEFKESISRIFDSITFVSGDQLSDIGLNEDQIALFKDLLIEQITASGKLVVAEEQLAQVKEIVLDREKALLKIQQTRAATLAPAATAEAVERLRVLDIETRAAERLAELEGKRGAQSERERDLVSAEAELAINTENLEILKEQNRAAEASLAAQVATATFGAQQQELLAQLLAQRTANTREEELRTAEIRRQNIALEIQQDIKDRPLAFGATFAITDFIGEATDDFQNMFDLMTTALNGFVKTAREQIVSIFDPRKAQNSESVKAAFGQYLLEIASLIIDNLIKKVIAAGLLQILPGGLPPGVGPTGPVPVAGEGGFHGGGEIPKPSRSKSPRTRSPKARKIRGYNKGGRISDHSIQAPSVSHYQEPQGFRIGGMTIPRPKGLHPKDTVPIWAQTGEWVMRLKAVRLYGRDFMHKLNLGQIDPSKIRSLAGSNRAARHISLPGSPSMGFAEGGLISDRLAQSTTGGAPSGDTESLQLVQAFFVPDDATAEMLLSSGEGAFLNFLSSHRNFIKGLVN